MIFFTPFSHILNSKTPTIVIKLRLSCKTEQTFLFTLNVSSQTNENSIQMTISTSIYLFIRLVECLKTIVCLKTIYNSIILLTKVIRYVQKVTKMQLRPSSDPWSLDVGEPRVARSSTYPRANSSNVNLCI